MNPVDSFVSEACIVLSMDEKKSMSKNDFTKAYKWWVAQNNLPQQQCKLNSVAFSSLRTYGVHEVNHGHGGAILENIILQPHVIPLIAEWEQSKGGGG
jgi:nicotinamide mononucleotide adenylyltransferase